MLHACDRLAPRFREQFGVALEFTADEVLEACGDIAADVFGADRAARDESVVFDDLASRDGFEVGEDALIGHCREGDHFPPRGQDGLSALAPIMAFSILRWR